MGNKWFPAAAALVIHLLILAVMALGFQAPPKVAGIQQPPVSAVEAVAVDESRVLAELERLKTDEQARQQREVDRQRKLDAEAKRAQRAREQEEQRLADVQKKRVDEQRQRDQEARRQKAAAEVERKRLAQLKQEQAALEQKRVAEQKRLADIEAKQKQEQEKQRKAEEARRLAEEEQKRVAAIEAEARLLDEQQQAARSRQLDRLKDRYAADIMNQVQRNWLRPAGVQGEASCEILVHQLPGGEVMEVQVLQSCGNPVLDRSVENAVRKASPLPPPPDPELFERKIKFTFRVR